MKTKTQHTPTPDALDVLEYASCQSCGSKMIAYKVRATIVRAVNSHEALIEAAKDLLAEIDEYEIPQVDESGDKFPLVDQLRAAIEQATGRK